MDKIQEAVAAMEEIVYDNRENMMEKMWRCGKGELFILKYLSDKNSPAIPSEISDAMHTSTARVSAALGSLEKKEQIYREIDVSNRRNILVTITKKGRERVSCERQELREQITRVFTEMGEDDAVSFVRLLSRFFEIADRVFEGERARG